MPKESCSFKSASHYLEIKKTSCQYSIWRGKEKQRKRDGFGQRIRKRQKYRKIRRIERGRETEKQRKRQRSREIERREGTEQEQKETEKETETEKQRMRQIERSFSSETWPRLHT